MNPPPAPPFTKGEPGSSENTSSLRSSTYQPAEQMNEGSAAIAGRVGDALSTPPNSSGSPMTRESNFSTSGRTVSSSIMGIKSGISMCQSPSLSSVQHSPPISSIRDEGIYIPDIEREEVRASIPSGTESKSIPLPGRALSSRTKTKGGGHAINLKPRSRKFHDPLESFTPTTKKFRSSSDDSSGRKRANMYRSSSPLYSSDNETELMFQSFVTYIDDKKDGSDNEYDSDGNNNGDGLSSSSPTTTTIPNMQNHNNSVALTKPRPIRRPLSSVNEVIHSPKTTGSNATLPTSICSAFAVKS